MADCLVLSGTPPTKSKHDGIKEPIVLKAPDPALTVAGSVCSDSAHLQARAQHATRGYRRTPRTSIALAARCGLGLENACHPNLPMSMYLLMLSNIFRLLLLQEIDRTDDT